MESELNEECITIHEKKFYQAPNLDKIQKGEMEYIPMECLLGQYILKSDNLSYYISLEDNETGNLFEIYEFEYVGNGEEEYRLLANTFTYKEHAEFLFERIKDKYNIFIERKS